MARRRLTIKRLDPWSVLKFGAVANVVLLAIFLLIMGVVWFIVERLQLIDQACGIATDVGFTTCGVNPGNLFRALVLLGLLWVVIQTAVLVFLAFLHNLIADLTGGLVIGVVDDTPAVRDQAAGRAVATTGGTPVAARTTGSQPVSQPAGEASSSRRRRSTDTPPQGTPRRPDPGDDELFADR